RHGGTARIDDDHVIRRQFALVAPAGGDCQLKWVVPEHSGEVAGAAAHPSHGAVSGALGSELCTHRPKTLLFFARLGNHVRTSMCASSKPRTTVCAPKSASANGSPGRASPIVSQPVLAAASSSAGTSEKNTISVGSATASALVMARYATVSRLGPAFTVSKCCW